MTSLDYILSTLPKSYEIQFFRFFFFDPNPKAQQRLASLKELEARAFEDAVALKKRDGINFWEAVIRQNLMGNNNESILGEIFFHNKNGNFTLLSCDQITDFIGRIPSQKSLAINSEVTLIDGRALHIPMLDFKVPISPAAQRIIEFFLNRLNLTGALFNSGKSYHFISSRLITQSELIELLAKFILIHPISDKSWAAHQIIERSASLRVTWKPSASPPQLIKMIAE